MSNEALSQTHDKTEQWLFTQGNERLRRHSRDIFSCMPRTKWLTDRSLTMRLLTEPTHRRHVVRQKPSTVFGGVNYHRIGSSAPGRPTLYPLDKTLNLGSPQYSEGLIHRAAIEASKASFDECVNSPDRATGDHLPKRQCKEIVAQATQDFEAFYHGTAEIGQKKVIDDLLVISTDSKGIVMHTIDRRPATTAAVYTFAPSVRSLEQVMR